MAEDGFGGPVVIDNSAWARLIGGNAPQDVDRRWQEALEQDEVVVCDAFRLEALYSARDAKDYVALAEELRAFRQARCDHAVWTIAGAAQYDLATDRRVSHRVKPVDLLVAAAAHQHAVGVLHYDKDFDLIAEHTRLAFRSVWLAPRGTLN